MRKFVMLLLVVGLSAEAEVPAVVKGWTCYFQDVIVECEKFFREAEEQGNVATQFLLGWIYYSGSGVTKDYGKALHWFRAAAEQGDADAQYNLGVMYNKGEGVAIDYGEALRWYRLAAEQGGAKAQIKLGLMYYSGDGVTKDYDEGLRWFRAAAEQEDIAAQNILGLMYYFGKGGVTKDYGEAFRWFRAAAEQGNVEAQIKLGLMYDRGEGVTEDEREALRWYRAAAEQGNANAQYIVGVMYYFGKRGVTKDYGEALRWYRPAAAQGNADAQFRLGLMYNRGEGVAIDYGEALRWYRMAAEQGDEIAQFNLGLMYDKGEGVTEDEREALRWYRMAAEQGYVNAQIKIGAMYYNGTGVVKDEREAYVWFLIAMASESKKLGNILQEIPWKEYLTFTEIKSVKREAARRFEKIENRRKSIQNSDISQKNSKEYAFAKPFEIKTIATEVYGNTWPSVVVIKHGVDQGGGVVIRPNLVATSCHVIKGGGKIAVYKPGNEQINEDSPFYAKVVHRNEAYDFCVLEVDGLWAIPATIRKYETLQVGENVYALGAPHGLGLSLSKGVISQLWTLDEGKRYIQTDAATSSGSSGGGLFDVEGDFIGILTRKSAEGIGFAIPADLSLEF